MKRKKIIITLVITLSLLTAVLIFSLGRTPLSSDFTIAAHTDEPQSFIAHRGLSSIYPENTIPAIQGAIDNGFYGVEFDIHTTQDGIWILNHDSDIDKMTNGTGDIDEMTFNEIQQFTVDHGNNIESYADLKLPRLEDALKIIEPSGIIPYIEIKGYNIDAFENLLLILEQHNLSETAVIISFDMEALLAIRKLDKNIQLMYCTNTLTMEDVDTCIANGNIGVDINFGLIFKMTDEVKYAQDNGLTVACWTVDIPFAADLMNFYGIKFLTTNRILP